MAPTPPKACVIGHPIGHSRSPLIHNHWLGEHGLAGTYGKVDVTPEALPGFLSAMRAEGYVGANVTVPHKEAAATHVAVLSDTARALGAVNTLSFDADGRLCGDNTDVFGFLANLDEAVPGWDERVDHAMVLGAGGAAKAIVQALASRGIAKTLIVNRNGERAAALAARFGGAVAAVDWEAMGDYLPRTQLLINCTSLGMRGQPPLSVDLSRLPGDAIVNDIVYVPLDTHLLAAARDRGLTAVDGLGMLLHQAVPAFERWFGIRPRVTPELRELVARDIRRTEP